MREKKIYKTIYCFQFEKCAQRREIIETKKSFSLRMNNSIFFFSLFDESSETIIMIIYTHLAVCFIGLIHLPSWIEIFFFHFEIIYDYSDKWMIRTYTHFIIIRPLSWSSSFTCEVWVWVRLNSGWKRNSNNASKNASHWKCMHDATHDGVDNISLTFFLLSECKRVCCYYSGIVI